jgi:hypothetical protein
MTGRKRFKYRLAFFQESGADVLAVRRNQIAPSARPYRGATPFDGGVTFRVSAPFALDVQVQGACRGWNPGTHLYPEGAVRYPPEKLPGALRSPVVTNAILLGGQSGLPYRLS